MRKRMLAACLAWTLLGCAHVPPAGCAALPGGGSYCLRPSTTIAPVALQQHVALHYRGGNETLIVGIEVDAQGMRMAGLTPFGQKIIQAEFDNHSVRAPLLPGSGLDATLLLALLQISLWPEDDVRQGLRGSLRLESSGRERVLLRGDVPLMRMQWDDTPWPHGQTRIEWPAADLRLDIQTF